MKISVSANDLRKALAFVAKHSDGGMTIPVLGCVLMSASGGRLTLKSTNLNAWASTSIPVDIVVAGGALVNAATLYALVGKIAKDAAISMMLDDGVLTVTSGKSRSKMPCLPVEDFPAMPDVKEPKSFDIDHEKLAKMIYATISAASNEEARFYLCGLHLSFIEKGVLRITATNGHRAALVHADVANPGPDRLQAIIPTSSAEGMLALCKSATEPVSVSIYDNFVSIRLGSGEELLTRVIDGTFPDVDRVRPSGIRLHPVVDRESLASALASAIVFRDARNGAVKLTFADGELNVECRSGDKGEGRFPADTDYDGERIEIGVNAKYLADTLASFSSDTVVFGLIDAGSVFSVQTSVGSRDVNIVMPCRV
jgi:DNA polymerase-3 subunit beta